MTLKVENGFPSLKGDANRLRQVLTHLMDNAIKYNRDGGSVEVTLSCGLLRVRVSVRDTGVGIAPGDLGLVFRACFLNQ